MEIVAFFLALVAGGVFTFEAFNTRNLTAVGLAILSFAVAAFVWAATNVGDKF